MAIRLTVWISPVDSRASISRLEGEGLTCRARAIRPFVVLPMAEHTTTRSLPSFFSWARRRAMAMIFSGVATLLPPYLCTNRMKIVSSHVLRQGEEGV